MNTSLRKRNIPLVGGTGDQGKVSANGRVYEDAAEGAVSVQTEISDVIEASQSELQIICQFFDQIKELNQEVVKHIDRASRLGTTKSAMFEDMDNI